VKNPRAGGAAKTEAGRRGDQAADGAQVNGGDHGDSLPFFSSLSRSLALTGRGFSMPSFPSFKSRTTIASSNEVEAQWLVSSSARDHMLNLLLVHLI